MARRLAQLKAGSRSPRSERLLREVKTRRVSGSGRGPWEALHERKRRQVRRMAAAFLLEVADRPHSPDLRFDAIGVVIDAYGKLVRLDHLEAAF